MIVSSAVAIPFTLAGMLPMASRRGFTQKMIAAVVAWNSRPSMAQAASNLSLSGRVVVRKVSGTVWLLRKQFQLPLTEQARLLNADRVHTEAGSELVLDLEVGRLALRPSAVLVLELIEPDGTGEPPGLALQLLSGALRLVSAQADQQMGVRSWMPRVGTPYATIGLRGTDVDIIHQEGPSGAATYLRVREGQADLTERQAGATLTLNAGQQAVVERRRLAADPPRARTRGAPPADAAAGLAIRSLEASDLPGNLDGQFDGALRNN